MSTGNRGQLADFLRSRRARLTPADVGLPGDSEPGRRRTPGLRREEVAELSGVGVTWTTPGRPEVRRAHGGPDRSQPAVPRLVGTVSGAVLPARQDPGQAPAGRPDHP
ncbi:MAG TPA: XRE family transcriptional regulator, partial [Streptosporangiaceae bacterium]|nr:XRE family transcriptional regulator [Streptosporangiaceae bacterium]